MSFILMIIAGLIPSVVATLLMRGHNAAGLFILGIGGSIIAAVMQYSENQPVGFIGPFVGAIVMLFVYALTARPPVAVAEKASHEEEDFRKAA